MSTPAISKMRGTGHSLISQNRYGPDFSQLHGNLSQAIGPGLTGGLSQLAAQASGSPEAFAALEAPAMRDFQSGLGQIASRFSGMGTGARRSSGFGHATNAATQDFAERLQSQRLGFQQSAMQQLMQMYGLLSGTDLQDTWMMENAPKKPSWWKQAAGIGLPLAGGALGGMFGGPMGAALGANLGGGFSKAMMGGDASFDFSGISDLPTKWRG